MNAPLLHASCGVAPPSVPPELPWTLAFQLRPPQATLLVLGDSRWFAGGVLRAGLSIELEDPLPLDRHEKVISLLYRWMFDEDLGCAT
jgi:hypothetical protein